MIKVYYENFSDFPLEQFPYDKGHSALGEYHHIMPEGYYGNWYDPICNHQWRSLGSSWMVTYDDKYYMEQNRGNQSKGHFEDVIPCLILNKKIMSNYVLEFDVKLYDLKNICGATFHYIHSRKLLAIVFENGYLKAFYKNQNDISILAEKPVRIEELKTYHLKIVSKNNSFFVYLDGLEMFNFLFTKINAGHVGLYSLAPCAYTDFTVYMEESDYMSYQEEDAKKNTPLKLIKKIDLKDFGSGRQIRIGHLNENELFMVFIQHQKRLIRDSFAHISCMTAVDFNGNVLWQKGKPHNIDDNTLISADLPVQIYDIDNDGVDEIIYAFNFEVCIANAITGEIKKKMKTPLMDENYPFTRLNVDSIRVADFEGLGYKGDFIIKDRYKNVWAYNTKMELMWHYEHKNTGHFPYIYDFNGDGIDEMYVGYDMVSSKGEILWSLPIDSDHTDEIIYASLDGVNNYLYLASGNEGFNIVSLDGKIVKSIPVGHAQRICIGHFDPNKDTMQVCVTSFWGANSIIYFFDEKGEILWEKEMAGNGNIIAPVCYDGNKELILLNASPVYGGIMDYSGEIVIDFADDGHPTLCSEALDINNDGVDEILTWDQYTMYIYSSGIVKNDVKVEKYPLFGFSNYRGEYLIKKKALKK